MKCSLSVYRQFSVGVIISSNVISSIILLGRYGDGELARL